MTDGALPSQCYYVECPDSGVRMSVTFTATSPDQVLPPALENVGCIGGDCAFGHHTLMPISPEEAAVLMDDDDDDDRLDAPTSEGADFLVNGSAPDTSQPYFLDLINRIDRVAG
jgi:hypothetical protein